MIGNKREITGFWSFPVILAIGILLSMILSSVIDNDTWWLLTMGKSIIEDGIPDTEPLTMHQGMDFIAQQWLSSVIFYEAYKVAGYTGLVVFGRLLQLAITAMLFLLCKEIGKKSQAAGLFFTISSATLVFAFGLLRPQVFTFCILTAEVLLLEKYAKSGKWQWLCPFPILSVLQINLHASMWLMLFVFAAPFLAEAMHTALLKCVHNKDYDTWVEARREYAESKAGIEPLLCAIAAGAVTGLANPYGLTAITYIFRSYGIPSINNMVSEMEAPSWTNAKTILLFVVISVLLLGIAKKRLPIRYVTMATGTTILALMHSKGFAYLLLFNFPIIGYAYSDKIINLNFLRRKFIPQTYTRFMAMLLAVISVVTVLAKDVYNTTKGDIREEERYGWAEVLQYAEENTDISADSVIYAGYNSGGYLEFFGYRPYIDARAEIFLEENNHQFDYLNEFEEVNTNPLKVNDFLEKYGFDYLFVEEQSAIHSWLEYQGEYSMYEVIYQFHGPRDGGNEADTDKNESDNDGYILTVWQKKGAK